MHNYLPEQIVQNMILNINQYLSENNWTLRILSDKSDIPYETLKKIANGKINNPSIISLVKLSNAFNCTIDSLICAPNNGWKNVIGNDFNNTSTEMYNIFDQTILKSLPKRSIHFLSYVANFELSLTRRSISDSKNYIPVVVPTNHLNDAMIYDSCYLENIDVSSYAEEFQNHALFGLKITNKCFHPAYMPGDVLLIARDRHPNYGEIGLFICDNKIFLRQYIYGNPSQLLPINGIGLPITIKKINDWQVFGRVLTVARVSESPNSMCK